MNNRNHSFWLSH